MLGLAIQSFHRSFGDWRSQSKIKKGRILWIGRYCIADPPQPCFLKFETGVCTSFPFRTRRLGAGRSTTGRWPASPTSLAGATPSSRQRRTTSSSPSPCRDGHEIRCWTVACCHFGVPALSKTSKKVNSRFKSTSKKSIHRRATSEQRIGGGNRDWS